MYAGRAPARAGGKGKIGLRDRRTYDARRQEPGRATRDASQRNALIAILFFVAAFTFVGVMLLTGRGNDAPSQASDPSTSASLRQIGGSPTASLNPTTPQVAIAGATSTAKVGTPASNDQSAKPTDTASTDPTEETAEPTQEPATEPSAPEPTVVPLIGDFGALPPAQIVSGGLSRRLSLTYVLDKSSVSAPETGTVFKFIWPDYTVDDVSAMAAQLGVSGEVQSSGNGAFHVSGSGKSLSVRSRVIQYSDSSTASAALANDATLIAAAESWLSSSGLVSSGVGGGHIIGRNDGSDLAVVLVQPSNPAPLLAASPSAAITVTGNGVVREANIQWPADYIASEYGMRSLSEVWNQVLAGHGAIEADMSGVPGSGAVTATFTVESVGIAYSVGAGNNGEFLMPIMVFNGTAVSDDGTAFPMWVYISAVQGETATAG